VVNSFPIFFFHVKLQEIDCLISTKEEDRGNSVVVQGSKDRVTSKTYILAVRLHDEPNIEIVGHEWEVITFHIAESHKMLL
jgi:hypothetical protein